MSKKDILSRDDINNIFSSFVDDDSDDDDDDECDNYKTSTDNLEDKIIEEDDEYYCKFCDKDDALVITDGQYECKFCGVKQEYKFNMEQEWRFYGDSDTKGADPNRVGMPTNALLPESSLGSVISSKGADYSKIRQYHQFLTMPYKERSLFNSFLCIQRDCQLADITNIIIEDAKSAYKEVSAEKISRGSTRKGIRANSIYHACKKNGVPRSIKEIAKICGITVSEMTRGKKKFEEIMNQKDKNTMSNTKSTNPFDYIDRFCSKLNISIDIKYICQFIVFNAIRLDILDDNTPPSIACGGIFLVSSVLNLGITKTMVHQVTGVSAVTISKCYKKLNIYKKFLFPKAAITKYNIQFTEKPATKKKQYKKRVKILEDVVSTNDTTSMLVI
jgi:transcription initiation factor TFIIB